MKYIAKAEKRFLVIPIKAERPEKRLEIFSDGRKLFDFQVPTSEETPGEYDYYSFVNIDDYHGQDLVLSGDFEESFFQNIGQADERVYSELKRPLLHFTADRGWINDPNGMVYSNGKYHLFFQYNPMNTQWQNMSWGHSVSEDLLHFHQVEDALYPDENGTMYSGCGIVNERAGFDLPKDALLFFYSAAGSINEWSKGKLFTQRLAYSLDDGKTLHKYETPIIGEMEEDTRDPKIFWHEETNSYIMVLWIRGFEFGIFRSEDLKNWEQTDSFVLDQAWECPDLFCLEYEGEKQWVFMSADGFYYFGDFDGWHFRTDGVRREAYMTKLPYAAQSFSGLRDRVVCIPWMRTKNPGKLYTGMMGIPREMRLEKVNGEKVLSMVPVREYEESKILETAFAYGEKPFEMECTEEKVVHVQLNPEREGETELAFFGQRLVFGSDYVKFGENITKTVLPLSDIHVIIDREILEIYANHGTMNFYYETDVENLLGRVEIKGSCGNGNIYTWQ